MVRLNSVRGVLPKRLKKWSFVRRPLMKLIVPFLTVVRQKGRQKSVRLLCRRVRRMVPFKLRGRLLLWLLIVLITLTWFRAVLAVPTVRRSPGRLIVKDGRKPLRPKFVRRFRTGPILKLPSIKLQVLRGLTLRFPVKKWSIRFRAARRLILMFLRLILRFQPLRIPFRCRRKLNFWRRGWRRQSSWLPFGMILVVQKLLNKFRKSWQKGCRLILNLTFKWGSRSCAGRRRGGYWVLVKFRRLRLPSFRCGLTLLLLTV